MKTILLITTLLMSPFASSSEDDIQKLLQVRDVVRNFWGPCTLSTGSIEQVEADTYIQQGFKLVAKIQMSDQDLRNGNTVYPASSCYYYFVRSGNLK